LQGLKVSIMVWGRRTTPLKDHFFSGGNFVPLNPRALSVGLIAQHAETPPQDCVTITTIGRLGCTSKRKRAAANEGGHSKSSKRQSRERSPQTGHNMVARGSICQHLRHRKDCKDCGGPGICEHLRRRRDCKDCGGAGICQHKRHKNMCWECGGPSICQHQRRRSRCKQCRADADESMPAGLEELDRA